MFWTPSPTPNNSNPTLVPTQVLAKILNSNSYLTAVQLAGMACLSNSTDLFIKLNSDPDLVFRLNPDLDSTPFRRKALNL